MWLHAEVVAVDDIPRYWAKRTPQATALIDRLGKTTYAELDRSSDRVASAIVAAGIRLPANIGFLGKNSSRYFELLFGVTKAGCAIAPLNWRLAVPELVAIIEDAECPLIFVDREYAEIPRAVAEACRHPFRTVVFDSASAQPNDLDAWIADAADAGRPPRVHAAERMSGCLIEALVAGMDSRRVAFASPPRARFGGVPHESPLFTATELARRLLESED